MATIKSYTDISQSKELAKILPLESADYCWGIDDETLHYNSSPYPCAWKDYTCKEYYIPCWSLAALLDILSKWAERVNEAGIAELSYEKITKWCVSMLNCGKIKDCYADNPVDACYEMIIKLHGLNLL